MTTQANEILCGKCRVAVEGPANPKDQDVFSCPSCGRSETLENVTASVEAFTAELVANRMQKTMRKMVRGSDALKVKLHPVPKGNYPFIVDLKL